jgi:hypothetical protein
MQVEKELIFEYFIKGGRGVILITEVNAGIP